ncbi:MAG TPA: hypothetical protein VFL64_00065 [Rhizobacter sp.]|nr:hypothetical protein [Rhizobacter sp.]
MSVDFILGLAALGTSAALVAQWVVLRARYLKGLTQQRTRHQQLQQATQQQLGLAKQQISRLQNDLNITRMQVKRQASREPARAVVQQMLVEEPATMPMRPPANGFADTLPQLQFPHDASLLQH